MKSKERPRRIKEEGNAENHVENDGEEMEASQEVEDCSEKGGNDPTASQKGEDEKCSVHEKLDVEEHASVRSVLLNKPHSINSEAGVIKKICLENFMCHRKFTILLNRNVNFIYGQNGSGKSAILAAIQICLGASARRTNRARNLKELVRKDGTNYTPTSAKVRVTLLNQQNDGYKYDLYGDEITVERVISLAGGFNGYRMLDSKGKEQSRLKKDLDDMLDTLNIQVENPVAVLDQEESKKFLMGKAEDKYNFFMKATELERVDRSYATTLDSVLDMTDANNISREGLKQRFDQAEILKKKYEEHVEIDNMKAKLQQMRVKYAWSYYHNADKDHRQCLEIMAKFQEKAANKEQELSQAEESLSSPSKELEVKQQRLDSLLTEAQQQESLKKDLQKQLQLTQTPYKSATRELESLKREQTRVEKQLVAARKRLQTARDQIIEQTGAAQSEEARRMVLLKKVEEELVIAKEKVPTLRQTVSSALRSYEELEPHVLDSRNKVKKLSNQIHGVGGTIRQLESKSGDSAVLWGRNVLKVQQMILDAKGRVHGPVVGPIGSFIKIIPGKEEYASLAELAIGNGTMDRFLVTNDNDRQVLQDIRKKAGCSFDCGIFQLQPNARYNVPPSPDCDGIETVASVLKIDNDLVFNCLVDNAKIDQVAIARTKKLSEDQLLCENGSDYFIKDRNIKNVYFLPQGDNWTVKNGSLSMFSNERKLRQTIGVDRSGALAAAKREQDLLQEELIATRKDDDQLNHDHSKYQREWTKAKKAMHQNEANIADLVAQIESIKNEIETSATVTINTTGYEEDVLGAEEAVASARETEDKLESQLEEMLPSIKDFKSRLDDCCVRNSKVIQDIDNAEADLTQHLESVSQQKNNLEKKRQKVEKFRLVIKNYQKKLGVNTADRDEALLTAQKLTFDLQLHEKIAQDDGNGLSPEDIQLNPTPEDLENIKPMVKDHDPPYWDIRIQRQQKKLEAERQKKKLSKEDPAIAYEKYIRARDDLSAKTKLVTEVDRKISLLNADLKDRKRRWKTFRDHLTRTTSLKFSDMLSINAYTGDLTFDHGEKTLDLGVHKSTSHSQGISKDVKSLSGGERSYTTMCLLVALGETLETPFRIFDEFDVFLDAVARKLTIKALIFLGKRMAHRQFIFITPQDLSNIEPDDKLQIWKMTNPQRHVDAGGLSQQILDFAPIP